MKTFFGSFLFVTFAACFSPAFLAAAPPVCAQVAGEWTANDAEALQMQGPKGRSAVTGTIARVGEQDPKGGKSGRRGSILVENITGTSFSKALIYIGSETTIHKQEKGGRVPAAISDLKVGGRVEIVLAGPVAFSFPAKAQAKSILILRDTP